MSLATTGAAYPTINTVNALLPPDLLSRLAAGNLDHLTPGSYGLPDGFTLRQAAARAWELLLPSYRSFQTRLAALPENDPATVLTRDRWTSVLLRELGYDLTTVPNIQVDNDTFDIRHMDRHVPVHILGWNVDIDKRSATKVRGASRTAPHSLIQELLNRSDQHLWAVLTNGKRLRLLRDNIVMGRPAYIEFDLEGMFGGEQFADFAILYTLGHATRLRSEQPAECILEQWRSIAIKEGTRALEHLRDGVLKALKTLGTGFLEHPENLELRDLLTHSGAAGDYYRWLLRLVYRLIFLFVAEDRNLLHSENSSAKACRVYAEHFSTARLRRDATRRRAGRHADKWHALKMVFAALGGDGEPTLALPAYGSALFDSESLGLLNRCNISNENLLRAISYLSELPDPATGTLRSIDYKNLGSEELGSVYESLLEYVPSVKSENRAFSLDAQPGSARKTTGSYYTSSELVEAVLDQSLDPLLDEALTTEDPIAAIMAITVCDPACGSGHFLVAAARRIAHRLAVVRTGDPEPTIESVREAMRDVVAHCIYGVDLNDLAAELAKISLWLETLTPGRPLAFLDSHIKVGNGLIGATPALLAKNIPDVAFNPLKGDNRTIASSVKKRNRLERERIVPDQGELWQDEDLQQVNVGNRDFGRAISEVEASGAAHDIETLRKQADAWRRAEADPDLHRARLVADAWCAAFLWPLDSGAAGYTDPITHRTLLALQKSPEDVPLRQRQEALGALARRYRFFHWHLEFPQIFEVPTDSGAAKNAQGWNGGFSLVLGNPPWDTLSPDRREFFGQHVEGIRGMGKAEQDKAIDALLEDEPIRKMWDEYERDLLAAAHFLKNSGRYSLYAPGNLGKGDFNVYRSFAEHALSVTKSGGFAAQIVPGGLYGGANASAIRKALIDQHDWRFLLICENRRSVFFPGVHPQTWFAVYAARVGRGPTREVTIGFGIDSIEALLGWQRKSMLLSARSIREQQPETYAIPDSGSADEAAISAKMYSSSPGFGAAIEGVPFRVYQREIDMGNDRDLLVEDRTGLPLFEGRMIAPFDYRAKKYLSGHGNNSKWLETPFGHHEKSISPQWHVPQDQIPKKVKDRVNRYRVGFGDVANPRNERTFVSTLIPPETICGDKVPTLAFKVGEEWAYLPYLAIANSYCMDFLARQRTVTLKMSYTVLDSLPIPRLDKDDWRTRALAPRALRLTAAGPEMLDFWNQMASQGWGVPADGPYDLISLAATTPEDRHRLLTEIEVIVARDVYGLSKNDLSTIMDTFAVLAKREVRAHGSFLTRDRVLGLYDTLVVPR